ncbi:FAD/NAD(P)-binding domain-containing protein [Mycena chlorophos]|uniref:FAD/NAD(P)-binding domain-containing protein n=1 Tax=Mycena chlorophos TaxID=658473 RepID=A0A8H6TQ29_MYCCL|nr:FAD/NAD(P)-binding domain-containing protein [Mycena chlorophos]
MSVPASAKVLVIGGGPGGSYAATCLARENVDVVLLEADKFPRYHVGESQLASLRYFLRFVDLEQQFEDFGFQKKPGAAFKLNQNKREGYTDFTAKDPANYSWNLVRSLSDELMLRHAAKSGANVIEETKVTEVEFKGEGDAAQPVAAVWKNKAGETGKITFDFVIDASGRNGIISSKYKKTRVFNDNLLNVASWGYWKGTGRYAVGTSRENGPFFESLTDESGWAWFIPLHDGTTSVGVVQNQDISNKKRAEAKERGEDSSTSAHYHRELDLAPAPDAPMISAASDYSYHASAYAGPHYRLVGDAACFIDPFFSSGVHLAISGGLSAAASVCAVINGQATDAEAQVYHHQKVDAAYKRFLLVVLSAYQQIRVQNVPVYSNENNFDEAFHFFRPIIQGNTDTGKQLAGDDLKKTVEFLGTHAFEPSLPEERTQIFAKYGEEVDKLPASMTDDNVEDTRARNILQGIAIRKLMRTEDTLHINNETVDILGGLRMVMKRGSLGLEKAEIMA